MNTIVTTAALQPCTRTLTSAHVPSTTWHADVDFTGAVRLRQERAVGVAVAATTAAAAGKAAAAATTPGPLAWSPPPC